ncbi:DNA polymerase Y family protein [Brevibacterium sp. BRM-1]|uniref:Y-family DNA polymerase n=1 Tax=Brevibacterium sp. BRM-1 TaxID=2999062 RepID=UPI002280CD24|nr:DNA polymerase Y family protein [Brevibacterium sp. BRM-1]WAL40808.1 DNA polymerase Y family protein [Brevibacterium sp. BRM-1]
MPTASCCPRTREPPRRWSGLSETPPALTAPPPAAAAAQRTLILTVPDWPAAALAMSLGLGPAEPVIALSANRVVACTAAARAAGVEVGLNKRAARTRCPAARALPRDTEAEHREFAAGIGVLEGLIARFTLMAPGTVALPAAALARTCPDEEAAVEAVLTALTDATGWEVFAGLADSAFAALLAARTATRVPPGQTPDYLAGQPIAALTEADADFAEFASLCRRLGLDRLGDLAALPGGDVYARFGAVGARAHRLASGLSDRLPVDHVRARDFSARTVVEPASTRSDVLSFSARQAAAALFAQVRAAGLVCAQATIALTAATGDVSARTWRLEAMEETQLADRARWQAEGWLASGAVGAAQPDPGDAPAELAEDGIAAIEITAAELLEPLAAQHNLFDAQTGEVGRTLERLQGLFGADAVLVPGLQGGREPAETNLWTPWRQAPHPERDPDAPWPGELPSPRPTLVEHTPVDLLDARGHTVIARPSGLDSEPALLAIPEAGSVPVIDYSSSWPVEAMWWEPEYRQYRVRLQVVTAAGEALLLAKEQGQWAITGRWA